MHGFTKEELEDDIKALEEEEKRQKQARAEHRLQAIELFLESPRTNEMTVLPKFLWVLTDDGQSSSLFNISVLNAMNYWNFPQMKKALTGLISVPEIETLYKMRFCNGGVYLLLFLQTDQKGVFWCIDDLAKAFKCIKKRPGTFCFL